MGRSAPDSGGNVPRTGGSRPNRVTVKFQGPSTPAWRIWSPRNRKKTFASPVDKSKSRDASAIVRTTSDPDGPSEIGPGEGHPHRLLAGREEVPLIGPGNGPVRPSGLQHRKGPRDAPAQAGHRRRRTREVRGDVPRPGLRKGDLGLDHEPFEFPVPVRVEPVVGSGAARGGDEGM